MKMRLLVAVMLLVLAAATPPVSAKKGDGNWLSALFCLHAGWCARPWVVND